MKFEMDARSDGYMYAVVTLTTPMNHLDNIIKILDLGSFKPMFPDKVYSWEIDFETQFPQAITRIPCDEVPEIVILLVDHAKEPPKVPSKHFTM